MHFRNLVLAVVTVALPCELIAQKPVNSGWPEYGGTLAGQRYATDKQVQAANVNQLQLAWTFHTHALDKPSRSNARASFEATPVLWNNTLYFDTPFNEVFAIDAATGKLKWRFDPQVNHEGGIYIVTSRGVSLWHAKNPQRKSCGSDVVFVATVDRRLIARDASTGASCTSFGSDGTVDLAQGVELGGDSHHYGFTSPPTIVGDTIVLGSSIADNQTIFSASGAVRGFDAITGKQKWSWEPLPWAANKHPRTVGSGNAWSIISGDPEHDLIFVPTGSASVDFYGVTRLGDDHDADSIVALQASTGRRVWAFQLVHHDLWDYDTPSEPVLFTFRGVIPAVAVTTKTNMVYVFNRLTGQPLYPINERAVPASTVPGEKAWPTQPFSSLPPLAPLSFTAADVHLHNAGDQSYCVDQLNKLVNHGLFTPPSRQGSLVYPGSLGGSNWGSSAFDPTTSILYTRISSLPFIVRQADPTDVRGTSIWARIKRRINKRYPTMFVAPQPPMPKFKSPDSGAKDERDESPQNGTPYRLVRGGLMTTDGTPCGPTPFGAIVAINLDTAQKLWSVPHGVMVPGELGSIGDGGVIATAGGLIFAASTNDPFLRAYNAVTGAELWRGALPVPSNATPMSYSVRGRQYIVIAAGGHGFIGNGQNDEVVAYALPTSKARATVTHVHPAKR